MLARSILAAVVCCWVCLALLACGETKVVEDATLSETALQGKAVFEKYQCGKCHGGSEEVAPSELAPDLTDPFLANDSMFVRVHLKFGEESKMPSLSLNEREARAVSRYVAERHRVENATVPPEDADAECPICQCGVNSEQARTLGLVMTYRGETYFFECEACMLAFEQAPEAFLRLWHPEP